MSEKESYRDNPLLKRVGIKYEYTEEEIAEYIKCSQDAVYFVEKYIKIVNVDEGLIPFRLWDFQKRISYNRLSKINMPQYGGGSYNKFYNLDDFKLNNIILNLLNNNIDYAKKLLN